MKTYCDLMEKLKYHHHICPRTAFSGLILASRSLTSTSESFVIVLIGGCCSNNRVSNMHINKDNGTNLHTVSPIMHSLFYDFDIHKLPQMTMSYFQFQRVTRDSTE